MDRRDRSPPACAARSAACGPRPIRRAHRPPGPVGRRPGHGQGQPARLAAGQDRHRGPVQARAVRHRPARPAGPSRSCSSPASSAPIPRMGKTFLLRLLLPDRRPGPARRAAPVRPEGHRRPAPLERWPTATGPGTTTRTSTTRSTTCAALREELPPPHQGDPRLPRDICPETKVTPDLASNKSLGLHPIVSGWMSARCGSNTPSTAPSSRRSAPTWSNAAPRPASSCSWPPSARTPSPCPPGSAPTRCCGCA